MFFLILYVYHLQESMERIELSTSLNLSRIVQGHWTLSDWGLGAGEILSHIEQNIDLGVTTFDHADIYGDYTCEELFGNALRLKPELRNKIEIITKTGIKLLSDKYPERKIKSYDYSESHIIGSVESSLKKLGTDRIDLLLLHRPSPLINPEEVAVAFSKLKKDGKVLSFGVSNFTPSQFKMLNSYIDDNLVTNQVEISPAHLEHFDNGNMDFFLHKRICPMAWSPVARGGIFNPSNAKERRINEELNKIADELLVNAPDKIAYAWLLKHPSMIIPVVGTRKIQRLKNAIEALNIDMSTEQWLRIYNASTGVELP